MRLMRTNYCAILAGAAVVLTAAPRGAEGFALDLLKHARALSGFFIEGGGTVENNIAMPRTYTADAPAPEPLDAPEATVALPLGIARPAAVALPLGIGSISNRRTPSPTGTPRPTTSGYASKGKGSSSNSTASSDYKEATSKAPSVSKSAKEPKSKAPSAYKSPKGTSASRSPTVSKGEGYTPPKGSSKGGPSGIGSMVESEEGVSYEYDADRMGRALPVAAFSYTTESVATPVRSDYEELANVTKFLFDEMYRYAYESDLDSEFLEVDIVQYTILASRLVELDMNMVFRREGVIPSAFTIEGIALQNLQPQGEYYNYYIELLRGMQSPVFSTTTAARFITNNEALDQATTEASNEEQEGTTNIATIVAPVVVSAFTVAAALVWYCYFHKKHLRRTQIIMEEYDAIEVKHQESDPDDSDDTVANSTLVTEYLPHSFSPGYTNYHHVEIEEAEIEEEEYDEEIVEEDEDDEEEVEYEFEEVTIDEEEVDFKKNVGEIKRGYVGPNVAEINIKKHVGELNSKPAQGWPASVTLPSESNARKSEPVTPPVRAFQPEPAQQRVAPMSIAAAAAAAAAARQQRVSRSPSPTRKAASIASSNNLSPKQQAQEQPIWATPLLRPVGPTVYVSPSANKSNFKPAARAKSPPAKPAAAMSTAKLPASKSPTDKRTADVKVNKGTSGSSSNSPANSKRSVTSGSSNSPANSKRSLNSGSNNSPANSNRSLNAEKEDDEKSVISIDSQSSSTPEFLKKFKEMGLQAHSGKSLGYNDNKATTNNDDDKSVMTIDSQSSSTPEFLKKFKQMGLTRKKDE